MRSLMLVLPLALAACATTGPGGGSISIETTAKGQALAGANCVARTNSGSWSVVTPGTITVRGVNGNLHVVCDKLGYRTSELIYTPSRGFPGSSVGVGVGGGGSHVGVGVGVSVPVMTGGGGYPREITIEMNPQ
jgi:hypothetical protein